MENEQKSTNKKLIIGIGVVAVIAVVAILFLFVFKGNGDVTGSYKLVEMTQGSTTYSGSQLDAMESIMGKSVGLELKADKTGTLEVFGSNLSPSILHTVIMVTSGVSIYFFVLLLFRDTFFIDNARKVVAILSGKLRKG